MHPPAPEGKDEAHRSPAKKTANDGIKDRIVDDWRRLLQVQHQWHKESFLRYRQLSFMMKSGMKSPDCMCLSFEKNTRIIVQSVLFYEKMRSYGRQKWPEVSVQCPFAAITCHTLAKRPRNGPDVRRRTTRLRFIAVVHDVRCRGPTPNILVVVDTRRRSEQGMKSATRHVKL